MSDSVDWLHMRRALRLAIRGRGLVEPNPMVGAVIARGARVLGEGWHRAYGGPHAEVNALRQCGWTRGDKPLRALRDATCYVTLEPCAHVGKTPPCADALFAAGIGRVVAAMRDPNPLVAGRGFARLRRAGIHVQTGLSEREARELNGPFVKLITTGMPWVILKWAQSIDGKLATRTGESRWITSEPSRRLAHALRGRVDGIMVGIGTVLADDPELTCRLATPRRNAARIVLDRQLRIPRTSKLVVTARHYPTIIFTGESSSPRKRRQLAAQGCELALLRGAGERLSLLRVLRLLGARGMTNVMVEGGSALLGAFMDSGLADEAWAFMAPRLIGGAAAPGVFGGNGIKTMADAANLRGDLTRCGPDLLWRARLHERAGA